MSTPATPTLLLYYDPYHTPLAHYLAATGLSVESVRILAVDLGDVAPARAPDVPGAIQVDARARFCAEQVAALILANGCYQHGYHLSAAIARPLLARICVEEARLLRAGRIVHGFAGNDALRFVTGVKSLAPELEVLSCAQACGSRTRANADGYTVSRNLAGLSIEAGDLEQQHTESDPGALARWLGLPDTFDACVERHVIRFQDGLPVALDGIALPWLSLMSALNELGCRFGVGWTDMVEDGYVGHKTRAVYFAPALSVLVQAHRDLERRMASPALNALKQPLDEQWALLTYRGHALDPAMHALDAFMRKANGGVNGEVVLHYAAGRCRVAARHAGQDADLARFAVYRAGQDFGFGLIEELSTLHAWSARQSTLETSA